MLQVPERAGIPAALLTGNALVDDEHARLAAMLDELRTICADFDSKDSCGDCSAGRIAGCESRYEACVAELLSYMCEHFRAEERLMKDSGYATQWRDEFNRHVEDHADISDRTVELLGPRDRRHTAGRVAELAAVVGGWLNQHIGTHDALMNR